MQQQQQERHLTPATQYSAIACPAPAEGYTTVATGVGVYSRWPGASFRCSTACAGRDVSAKTNACVEVIGLHDGRVLCTPTYAVSAPLSFHMSPTNPVGVLPAK
jgi:hypothetical protein